MVNLLKSINNFVKYNFSMIIIGMLVGYVYVDYKNFHIERKAIDMPYFSLEEKYNNNIKIESKNVEPITKENIHKYFSEL